MKSSLKWSLTLFIVLALVLTACAMPAQALARFRINALSVTTTDGWLTDFDLSLVPDGEGYYVFTITPQMLAGNSVSVNLDKFAALFLWDFYNVSSARPSKKLKIVNASGRTLLYRDYSFTTENILPRTDNIFQAATGTLTPAPALNRAFGSAYTAMLPTITGQEVTDLCLPVKGFDGKHINLMIAGLRPINDAMLAFYGLQAAHEVSLPQMMHFDANLQSAGYGSYGAYLRSYYNVGSLYDLPLETVYNVLGTTNGAQTAVTHWRDNTSGGKPIPAGEAGMLTNDFKVWGFAGLNKDPLDRQEYPYRPNYYLMETDAEVMRFAYDYLYAHGLRFSLDQLKRPFDTTDAEDGRGGDFGIKAYYEKTPGATSHMDAVLGGVVLGQGASLILDHVTAGLYVPNAWNQYRLYDFGFSLLLDVRSFWPPSDDYDGDADQGNGAAGPETGGTIPGRPAEPPPGPGPGPGPAEEDVAITDIPGQGLDPAEEGIAITVISGIGPDSPKTGDDAPLTLWLLIFFTSLGAVGILTVVAWKKRGKGTSLQKRQDMATGMEEERR